MRKSLLVLKMNNLAKVVAVLLCLLVAVSSLLMLLSPRAWFNLPSWLSGRGVLTVQKYGSGWRSSQIRILGAVFFFFVSGILYDLISDLFGN